MKVVVTGASGFIGKNLCVVLQEIKGLEVAKVVSSTPKSEYSELLKKADIIYHLAGINRPKNPKEFIIGNVDFTAEVLELASEGGKVPTVIFSSSVQAVEDNKYGKSKLAAERLMKKFAELGKINGAIYRIPGVFGKWSKPNYNSVVATFCYNVANHIPLQVRDPSFEISLVYVDDVVKSFISHLDTGFRGIENFELAPVYRSTLGDLAEIISSFPELRNSLEAPKVDKPLYKSLYSTYLSYLQKDNFSYPLNLIKDSRGDLFEWIKSKSFGQIFVSTTKPGVTRGNHYHHTKTEKFLVIRGEAEIRFRHIDLDKTVIYTVNGSSPTVIDIPVGYTHNITNTGQTELITLFWANEIFDADSPDTHFLKV